MPHNCWHSWYEFSQSARTTTSFASQMRYSLSSEVKLLAVQDSSRLDDPTLKSVSLQTFTGLILEQCPGLEDCKAMLPQIYRSFNTFKSMVPTYGAILLDNSMDYCLLVRGFQKHTTWGFPKGKIASNESEMECAIREVRISSFEAHVGPTFKVSP